MSPCLALLIIIIDICAKKYKLWLSLAKNLTCLGKPFSCQIQLSAEKAQPVQTQVNHSTCEKLLLRFVSRIQAQGFFPVWFGLPRTARASQCDIQSHMSKPVDSINTIHLLKRR